ncbi:MAG: threonylcarbamoyl-AMP synthase [Anaerovibrio sp.]|uniref:L-threonylcarbamoyladenylate synthase n=1 Tax=Anaerovibrio sp. TaxID=1872532 RepID=UPI0025CD450D|nr:L-threonylcarbamoyladenylate synthase [Anaerovibrio sp.]MCR5175226.1 threonylcarbamoyl-AMP synthase [Anaerovibrio sp.]
METEVVRIADLKKDMGFIKQAAKLIRDGKLVAMPTETVYGLAAAGLNPMAVRALYEAKERPGYKAFSLQISDIAMAGEIAARVPDMAWRLFKEFCPGPITVILPKRDIVPEIVTGGKSTVGIRIPDNEIALAVLKAVGGPLAVPSANISAHPSPVSARMVYDDMCGRIPMILDGGPCQLGVESTIVDCTGDVPYIVRQGAIPAADIMKCALRT